MARSRKTVTIEELVEKAEAEVLQTKEAYDKAVSKLKELRDRQAREQQKKLLDAVAKSKWNYDQIMELIQRDPDMLSEE